MAEHKHKVQAVTNDTKGGKSAMSKMNPQKPDQKKPIFNGIRVHDEGKDTWGVKNLPRYEQD